MENKLELKHLAPYLPYGLTCVINFPLVDEIGELRAVGLHSGTGDGERVTVFYNSSCANGRQIILPKNRTSGFKPLLIPLSELTEEQWIEVFKAGCPSFENTNSDFYVTRKKRSITIEYRAWTTYIRLEYSIDYNEFSITISTCFNQLAAFNKLFELHADVYGLLEAGLALNKLEHGK